MPIGKLLLKLKKAENIKRYQVERNLVPRSVAEHSDFVMKLCYVLAKWEERKFGNPINWKRLYGCTFHDGIEAWTGDILSYTKRTVPEMIEAVRLTEESFFESGMKKDIPNSWLLELRQFVLNPKDDTIEGKILEAADTIDVIFECREEVIRHNKDPFERILTSSLEKLCDINLDSCRYFLKYPLNDLNLHEFYSEKFKNYIDTLTYGDDVFENRKAVMEDTIVIKNDLPLEEGDEGKYQLLVDTQIREVSTGKPLTVKQIKDLKIFINPIDGGVYRVEGNMLIRDEAYMYYIR